ncbi:MAG: Uma2 family endonuclease [Symploca sp. SIO1C2]|nr:Uma2 family endonuclease [Symploca sp. SIO1C2]
MKTLTRWAVEDYHQMIEAGILRNRAVELLAGEVIEMSPEKLSHTFYGEELADYLRVNLTGKALIREARPITLANSEPEPDIAVVKPPRERYRFCHPQPEDIFWLIEISDSTLAKDVQLKSAIYAEAGIQEYWVLNLQQKQLIVFRSPQGKKYLSQQIITQGIVSPLAFPEVEVSVERLLK